MRTFRILGAFGLVCGCGWFDDGQVCDIGSTSCDGDKVRVCIQDDSRPAGSNGPASKWMVVTTCEDDPVRGNFTCGLGAEDRVGCVAESTEGEGGDGEPGEAQELPWLRVDVARGEDSFSMAHVSQHVLRGAPVAASSGAVAVVSYAGDAPLDAALVAVSADLRGGSVWVRFVEGGSLAVIDPEGRVLAAREINDSSQPSSVQGQLLGLTAPLPPTLRVLEPAPGVRVPDAWRTSSAVRYVTQGSVEALELVGQALSELPIAASSALTEVAFATSSTGSDENDDQAEGESMDAESEMPKVLPTSATLLEGTRLWVDVSPERLELLENAETRREHRVELVRRVGEAYAWVASTLHRSPSAKPDAGASLPEHFPQEVADLISARISPMLGPAESFSSAWSALHGFGVSLGLAGTYEQPLATQADAVTAGFAGIAGSSSAESDFGEYLARATLEGTWTDGPCDAIRDEDIDTLAPRLMVPLTKLYVLRGLGVLSSERLRACIGTLGLSSSESALAWHSASGERFVFEEEAQAVRTPYIHGEVHVSALAQRGNVNAVADLMYRSVLPGVVRLKSVVNPRAERVGATIALTNDLEFTTSPAVGGLLIVTSVTRDRIELRGLMIKLAEPVFGTSVWPLLTVSVDDPVWPEDE